MTKSSLLLLIVALLGPLLSSLKEMIPAPPKPAAPPATQAVAPPLDPPQVKKPAAVPPKLDRLEPAIASVKGPVAGQCNRIQASFPVIVKSPPSESGDKILLEGTWHSQTRRATCPLSWSKDDKPASSPLEIQPNDFFLATATLKCNEDALGPGFIRFKYCFDTASNCLCTYSESPFEVGLDTTLPAQNEALFYFPLGYAVLCLALGSTMLWRQTSIPGSGYSFQALGQAPFYWKIDDAWLANLNAATAIVGSLAALGLTAESLSAVGPLKEYSAWSAAYVLCAGLAATVFALLKRVIPGVDGAPPSEAGSLWGFYLANGFNLFGVGGQLLFAHYALEVLSKTLKLGTIASICVPYLPALLALATVVYVVTRFQLVAFASTPALMKSTSASPQNSML